MDHLGKGGHPPSQLCINSHTPTPLRLLGIRLEVSRPIMLTAGPDSREIRWLGWLGVIHLEAFCP